MFKNKRLIIITIVFFLTINTSYYWEGKLGFWAMPVTVLLILIYLGIGLALLREIFFAVKEKLANKSRLFLVAFLTIILTIIFIKPFGIINFDEFEGTNVLIAEREGVANCMTTLKLKSNNTFRQKSVCFGITEITGNYHFKNDTIYFDAIDFDRDKSKIYKFAIIKPSTSKKNQNNFHLILYQNLSDTIGYELYIIKNELNKVKIKSL